MPNTRMTEANQFARLVSRLDALIVVLLEIGTRNDKPLSIATKVRLLHQSGLHATEISKILGKTPSHVTKELTRLRRGRGHD